ncbi:outer membrane lipoprotein carrier protein LolA [Salinicola sp. DM10]|uniref:outer membrane lipoprotein carrier protein LolA n=1 Tax=Salinicola sp. DM10 TaxID=2815721 RepID=UPI001E443440|nr:outer membrane lipoprotein carrier protein LolA [Salinicola sp. DM10]MCE3028319.1 outer membrane lipoprotein carrier protein LolA [Salinicola sp. DM10]
MTQPTLAHRVRRLLSLLLACLCLGAPLGAYAFDLASLQQRLAATPSLAGKFTQQRRLADLGTSLDSSGRFSFVRGQRVVWQLERPVEESIELTPEAIVNGSGDRTPPGGEQVARLFLQLLEGDWQALASRFEIALAGDAEAWQVTLTPKAAALRERISSIALDGGRYIDHLTLRTPGGDTLAVRLYDQHPLTGEAP